MYRLFFIAKNNIKKQKGDMITFFILTCMAVFLIIISISTITGLGKVLETLHKETSGSDVEIVVESVDEVDEALKDILVNNPNFSDYEAEDILGTDCEFRKGGEAKWDSFSFMITSYDKEKHIQKLSLNTSDFSGNEVVVPYYLKNRFSIGDTLELKIDDKIIEFNVVGYNEDAIYANPMNMSIFLIGVSDEYMDKLEEIESSSIVKQTRHKVRKSEEAIAKNVSTEDLEKQVTEAYKKWAVEYNETHPDFKMVRLLGLNWDVMKGGGQLIPFIAMTVVLVFSVLIMAIAIIITNFSIKNFIQRNMKNTAIMEASGYTVREIKAALMMQIISVALVGMVFGIIISILLKNAVGNLVSSLLGISWNQSVNLPVVVLVSAAVILVDFISVYFAGKRYDKISTLDALRGGLGTHNYKKNYFAFDKTKLPVSLTLSLKNTFGKLGNNLVITFIAVILGGVMVVGLGLYQNYGKGRENIQKLTGIECGEVIASGDYDSYEKVKDVEGIQNLLAFTDNEYLYESEKASDTIYTMAYQDVTQMRYCLASEGRMPIHDNEVALTANDMKRLKVKIGDTVTVSIGDRKKQFIITGKYQLLQMAGYTAIMTKEGADSLAQFKSSWQYRIYTEEGIGYEEMKARLDEACPGLNISDGNKTLDITIGSLTSSMRMVCLIIVIVTALVVIFVEALIIRSKMVREWKDYGVNRALGFSSKELIVQTMISNIPAITVGSIIGVILACLFGKNLVVVFLIMFGVEKIKFHISVFYIIISVVGIVVTAAVVSGLLALRVRKLNPVEMITEE